MKGSHPRPADRCPFVFRHSISQATSFMQLGMLWIQDTLMNWPCNGSVSSMRSDTLTRLTQLLIIDHWVIGVINWKKHYDDVIMDAIASQITSLTSVYSRRLIRHTSKKTSKLRVTGLCAGNSPGTGEFPAQMASNAENVSIWWRHHDLKQNCVQHSDWWWPGIS